METHLIVVDSYSKWPEIRKMDKATSEATIQLLSDMCSTFGTPEILVIDNVSQFTSSIFREWYRQNGIDHFYSPLYPQSNGQAERFADTFKHTLLKSDGEGPISQAIIAFLRTYHSTPNLNCPGENPLEIVFLTESSAPSLIACYPDVRPEVTELQQWSISLT